MHSREIQSFEGKGQHAQLTPTFLVDVNAGKRGIASPLYCEASWNLRWKRNRSYANEQMLKYIPFSDRRNIYIYHAWWCAIALINYNIRMRNSRCTRISLIPLVLQVGLARLPRSQVGHSRAQSTTIYVRSQYVDQR